MAAALVLAQLRAQATDADTVPPLGLVYLTDHYAEHAQAILDHLGAELPQVTDWVGAVGVGICASGVEYWDEPALTVMLCDVAPERFRVFNGVAPLSATQSADGFEAQTALVHADPAIPDLDELVRELAERTLGHYLFGGLVASRAGSLQVARSSRGAVAGQGRCAAEGLFQGGLSGVAFGPDVGIVSRVTQGVRPVGSARRVTAADGPLVLALDGEPALDVLLHDLALPSHDLPAIVARLRQVLVGLQAPPAAAATPRPGRVPLRLGDDVLVRHIVGLDPAQRAFLVADHVAPGTLLTLCERHVQAARADLVRICAEIRDALGADEEALRAPVEASARVAGAVYVSCNGRGGGHFGAPSAELQIIRQALGEVPLVGFFAAGEIAHHRVYGYTGVLTVFVAD
ncbi:FIST C domain protein [Tepidimonas charontis]|uniref:FIST C domain protein n=2 Tax=Tepidimonas charontis TaxID=2267262 RepID=A0A554XIE3_9BURK|nr:FIST C domain protein [Tepidimonas charontis]